MEDIKELNLDITNKTLDSSRILVKDFLKKIGAVKDMSFMLDTHNQTNSDQINQKDFGRYIFCYKYENELMASVLILPINALLIIGSVDPRKKSDFEYITDVCIDDTKEIASVILNTQADIIEAKAGVQIENKQVQEFLVPKGLTPKFFSEFKNNIFLNTISLLVQGTSITQKIFNLISYKNLSKLSEQELKKVVEPEKIIRFEELNNIMDFDSFYEWVIQHQNSLDKYIKNNTNYLGEFLDRKLDEMLLGKKAKYILDKGEFLTLLKEEKIQRDDDKKILGKERDFDKQIVNLQNKYEDLKSKISELRKEGHDVAIQDYAVKFIPSKINNLKASKDVKLMRNIEEMIEKIVMELNQIAGEDVKTAL